LPNIKYPIDQAAATHGAGSPQTTNANQNIPAEAEPQKPHKAETENRRQPKGREQNRRRKVSAIGTSRMGAFGRMMEAAARW
jgi:hypothetical protein